MRQLYGRWGVAILLSLFVLAGVVRFWQVRGDDLAASYIGCRLVSTGNAASLYSHDAEDFAAIGDDDAWQTLAAQGNYHSYLHPYVQTPLWAYSLEPLCNTTSFPLFGRVFLALVMLCFAASVWLVARFWTPTLYHPFAIGLILLCLWFSQPFHYAMFLMQTHALFFLMTLAALVLAERDRPVAAGLLLALAAAVKVTPGLLLLYWLLTRRWRAAASMAVCSVLLLLTTLVVAGPHLTAAYFADLHRVSRVLLVAQNNQSFAAWWMGRFYSPDELAEVNIFPLPDVLRLGSMLLMLLGTLAGGLLDRSRKPGTPNDIHPPVPLGAMIALVALTLFAPIAWTHYSVILLAPLMLLAQESRSLRSWPLTILVLGIVALNLPPLASDVETMEVGPLALVRGQFYAGLLCLLALALAAWSRHRQLASSIEHTTPQAVLVSS